MCQHADLTTTLERRETYSARGRGLVLFAVEQGKVDWGADVADVMYRFFADGLCRHVCAGHIPHDEMVIDARYQLVTAGEAPKAVASVRRNVEETGNPWGEEEADLVSLKGAKPQRDVLVYFGPTARVRRQQVVTALATLFKRMNIKFSVLADENDPGLLLYQLGELDAGVAAAKSLAQKIARSGARIVVTPDADAYQTLKIGFGGVAPLSQIEVLHSSEFLLKLGNAPEFRKPMHLQVAYHDPCALARFAPCLEAPRSLLRAICGAPPLEIGVWSRDLANCSGECGGVPFIRPALSQKAAERRVREATEVGAELIVAGSPAAAEALNHGGLEVRELNEFIAESMDR
jgi:Fe-S oxidoreductase